MPALKDAEIQKPALEVVPTIKETGEVAVKDATASIDKLKGDAQLKQFNLAAMEYQKSENKLVAALGKAAEGFIGKKNFDDASLAIGMGEMLLQAGAVSDKYKGDWVSQFETYAKGFSATLEKGLTDESRKEAYLTMSVVLNNIGNAARMEKLDYFTEKAQSPKWKESTKNFVTGAIDEIKRLYDEGKFEAGDKALAYLGFFTDTILKQGIKGKEGRAAVEQAVLLALGESEKAEEMFQKGLKQYGVAMAVKQLWDNYAKLESSYNMTSDVYGKSSEAEKLLKEAHALLDKGQANKAYEKLNELAKAVNKNVKKGMVANIDDIQKDLKATPEAMEAYEKGLEPFAKDLNYAPQVKKMVGKLEKVSSDSVNLLDFSFEIEKDYQAGRENDKKTDKFFSKIEKFAKDKKDAIGTASAGVLLMGNIMSEKQYKQALKMGNVAVAKKGAAMESIDKAIANMDKSLQMLIEEGPDSKKAKGQYEEGIYNMTGAMALVDLEKLPYAEEEKKLAFFKEGSMKVYDSCVKAEATTDVWKFNDALHNMQGTLFASDDKLFATKEADLQKKVIKNTEYLSGHYLAKLGGETKGVFTPATVKEYEKVIAQDSATLGKKIANAEKINMAVKLAASFVHPSLFIATTVEMACKEYEVANTISWSTGLMLAASALAFRGAVALKGAAVGAEIGAEAIGVGTKALTAGKIASYTLTGLELGIGGTLMAHGGYQTYQMFKSGQYAEGALNLAMFALPLFYAAAHKPMMTYMGKKMPGFRQFTGEFITEEAVSAQGKKFGLKDVAALGKLAWEQVKVSGGKALEGIKVKGANVALVPMPMMVMLPVVEKIAKMMEKPGKLVEKPGILLDMVKKTTTGDKEVYPAGVEKYTGKKGIVGENFYDTVKQNAAIIKESLAELRSEEKGIIYKEKSEVYKALNNEMEGGAKGAKEISEGLLGKEYAEGMEMEANISVMTFDKGKTWMLNNIDPAFGDLGLFIYFKAAKNLEKEFGIATIRMSEQGDELLVILKWGEEGKIKTMGEYDKALKSEVAKIAEGFGLKADNPLTEAVTDFSPAAWKYVTVTIGKEGKVSLKNAWAAKEIPYKNIETVISSSEAGHAISALKDAKKDVTPLQPFLKLPEMKLPKVEIKNVKELEGVLDEVTNIRLSFDAKTKQTMWDMTEHFGKGVSQVDNGIIGPSVLNLLGHPVTDAITALYQDAVVKSLKKHKVPVEAYDHGPLSIGLKFEKALSGAEKSALDAAMKEAGEAFKASLAEKGITVEKVEIFAGKTKDEALHKIAEKVMGYKVSELEYSAMKQFVTVLHTNPEEIIGILKEKGVDKKIVGKLEWITARGIEKWVRNPEDLIHYLRNQGMDNGAIKSVFEAMDIKLGEPVLKVVETAEKAAVEKAAPEKKFKTDDEYIEELLAKKKAEAKAKEPAPVLESSKAMEAEDLGMLKAVPEAAKPAVKISPAMKDALNLTKKGKMDEAVAIFSGLKYPEEMEAALAYAKENDMVSAFGVLKDLDMLLANNETLVEIYGGADLMGIYKKGVTKAQSEGLLYPEIAGREAVLEALMPEALKSAGHNESLKSILFDSLPKAKELGGVVTNVKGMEGATGAYELSISGKAGIKKAYLKLETPKPEKQGIEISKKSGIIAPEITGSGEYLEFKNVAKLPGLPAKYEKVAKEYFITEDVAGIKNGKITLAGEEVTYDVAAASSMMTVGHPKNAVLGDYIKNNMAEAQKLYGEHWAAALADGTLDRHSKNVWFFKIDVTKNSPEVLAKLEEKGYKVITEADGKKYMYRFGGIDFDGGAMYPVKLSSKGEPEVGIGITEPNNSTHGMASIVLKLFSLEGKIPGKGDAVKFFAEDGAFVEGVMKWVNEHATDAAYKETIIKQFKSYEGEVGISHGLNLTEDAMLKKGLPVFGGKFAGEEGNFFLNPENARYKFIAEADRIVSENPIKYIEWLRQDTPYYMTKIGAGEMLENMIIIDGAKFKMETVVEGKPAPKGAVVVKRIGDNIIVQSGLENLKGIKTMKTGAIACFEAMMGLSEEGWAKIAGQAAETVINDFSKFMPMESKPKGTPKK